MKLILTEGFGSTDSSKMLLKSNFISAYGVYLDAENEFKCQRKYFYYLNMLTKLYDCDDFYIGDKYGVVIPYTDVWKYASKKELQTIIQQAMIDRFKMKNSTRKWDSSRNIIYTLKDDAIEKLSKKRTDEWGVIDARYLRQNGATMLLHDNGNGGNLQDKDEITKCLESYRIGRILLVKGTKEANYVVTKVSKNGLFVYDIKGNISYEKNECWVKENHCNILNATDNGYTTVSGFSSKYRITEEEQQEYNNSKRCINRTMAKISISNPDIKITMDDNKKLVKYKSKSNDISIPTTKDINSIGASFLELDNSNRIGTAININIGSNIEKIDKRFLNNMRMVRVINIKCKSSHRNAIKNLMLHFEDAYYSRQGYSGINIQLHKIESGNDLIPLPISEGFELEFADGAMRDIKKVEKLFKWEGLILETVEWEGYGSLASETSSHIGGASNLGFVLKRKVHNRNVYVTKEQKDNEIRYYTKVYEQVIKDNNYTKEEEEAIKSLYEDTIKRIEERYGLLDVYFQFVSDCNSGEMTFNNFINHYHKEGITKSILINKTGEMYISNIQVTLKLPGELGIHPCYLVYNLHIRGGNTEAEAQKIYEKYLKKNINTIETESGEQIKLYVR